MLGFVDGGVAIAHIGKPRRHGCDREVLGRDVGELVPGDRCRDRRTRPGPDAVGRGNRAIAGVLVVVDEDALAALLLPPAGRDLAWHAPFELTPECDRRTTHFRERPAARDPNVDVDTSASRGLRETRVAKLVQK